MTKLFLVRHGETEWNSGLRYQGHKDIPLSNIGRIQAGKIAKRLSIENLDSAYSSDLSRAVETARAITSYHNVELKILPDLREINFGDWEGKTYGEISRQFKEIMENWHISPRDTIIPGGESLSQVADRCMIAVNKIVSDNPDKNVLLVAHGGIIRIIVATVLGMDLNDYWKIKQDNVALNIIEFFGSDKAILCLLNDNYHIVEKSI